MLSWFSEFRDTAECRRILKTLQMRMTVFSKRNLTVGSYLHFATLGRSTTQKNPSKKLSYFVERALTGDFFDVFVCVRSHFLVRFPAFPRLQL